MKSRDFSKPWVRVVVFLWGIVFPLVFVAVPALSMVMGKTEFSMMPVWAFILWFLSPLVVTMVVRSKEGTDR